MATVNCPRVVRKSGNKRMQIVLAGGAVAVFVSLARGLDFDRPTRLDRRVRRLARSPSMRGAHVMLSPLFPIGLPGGYITLAYATSYWLHRRRKRGGAAIVNAAWLGWILHRAFKLGYRRERPTRPDVRRRTDSYPSGHTTGATALAPTLAHVLYREGLISKKRAFAIGLGLPAAMGVYRVLADDHWATDVVGGWLLGGAISLFVVASHPEEARAKRIATEGIAVAPR